MKRKAKKTCKLFPRLKPSDRDNPFLIRKQHLITFLAKKISASLIRVKVVHSVYQVGSVTLGHVYDWYAHIKWSDN